MKWLKRLGNRRPDLQTIIAYALAAVSAASLIWIGLPFLLMLLLIPGALAG